MLKGALLLEMKRQKYTFSKMLNIQNQKTTTLYQNRVNKYSIKEKDRKYNYSLYEFGSQIDNIKWDNLR